MSPQTGASAWWWPLGEVGGERPVLFFPPSGAEPSVAAPLVRHLGGLRFGVLQLPGRGARHEEPHPDDLPALLDHLVGAVRRLDGPAPVLVGHSFGGLLAYGVTAALEQAGVPPARLVTVASASPPSWAAELARDVAEHPDSGRAEFVSRRTSRILGNAGTSQTMLEHPELAARAAELVAVDVALSYQGFPVGSVRTPHTCIVARDDRMLDPGSSEGWVEVSLGPFSRIEVPGGHFFYRDDPARLANALRMDVSGLDSAFEMFG